MNHPSKKFLAAAIVVEILGLVNFGGVAISGFCRAIGAVLFILFLITNFMEDEMTRE
jgi:hypothetical protein